MCSCQRCLQQAQMLVPSDEQHALSGSYACKQHSCLMATNGGICCLPSQPTAACTSTCRNTWLQYSAHRPHLLKCLTCTVARPLWPTCTLALDRVCDTPGCCHILSQK
jgi:hypothetical protein